jgi:hypothetical protein
MEVSGQFQAPAALLLGDDDDDDDDNNNIIKFGDIKGETQNTIVSA